MKKIIIFLFLFLIMSCVKQPYEIKPGDPSKDQVGTMSMQMDMTNAPEDVIKISGQLSRLDRDTVYFDFVIEGNTASARVENLAAGTWLLKVDAFNHDNMVIYTGSTQVEVQPGVTTPVYLELNPANGSLNILVSWGGENEKIIFMTRNLDEEWRILTMNLDGSGVKDIAAGRYPNWINNRQEFIYLYSIRQLKKYNLQTSAISFLNEFPYSVNFLRYAEFNESIIFDWQNPSDYSIWNIGSVDLNGDNFFSIVTDDIKEKYPVMERHSDWIYYHSTIDGSVKIHRVRSDGSENQVFIEDDWSCEFPALDYTDKYLVYTKTNSADSIYFVVVEDLTTRESRQIDFTNIGLPTYPTFSQSGEYIILSVILGPEWDDRQLFRMRTDGTELEQITFFDDYKYLARPLLW